MMRRVVLALALACLVAAVAAAREAPPAVRTFTLKNGLRVLLAPDSSAGSVDVAVWYGAGPRWEKPGLTGVSHVADRLQFRGTARVPDGEFRRRLLALGGQVNTNSTADYTCLWETVPPEALEQVLDMEADRMAGLALTPAKIDQERRGTIDERRRQFDRQPLARGLHRLVSLLFPGHPYGVGLLGQPADLARMTARDVEAHLRDRYGPANALLTVVGRFDANAVQEAVERQFERVPRRGSPVSGRLPALAPLVRARAFEPVEGAGALLVVGWRGPAATDPDGPAIEVLARLLAGSSDTRLVTALQGEKSSVANVQCAWDARRDASLLWCAAAMRPGADTAQVEQGLLATTARLAAQPPEGHELDRARKRVLTTLLFGAQTPRARAAALGESTWYGGDTDAMTKRIDAIRRLTPADVQRAAQALLRDDRRAIVWMRGVSPVEGRP